MRSVTLVTPFWLWLCSQSLRTIGSDTTDRLYIFSHIWFYGYRNGHGIVIGIFRAFDNMRDIRDICDMLYGGTCFCILLIYPIYRAKYNKYQI